MILYMKWIHYDNRMMHCNNNISTFSKRMMSYSSNTIRTCWNIGIVWRRCKPIVVGNEALKRNVERARLVPRYSQYEAIVDDEVSS
mmetsp:Transcript_3107/g.3575  ORF Transcript_3107/g.3575 Transcript_3107/m.3575 type:complete len:86 (+) Transcript_3107:172-429(+)